VAGKKIGHSHTRINVEAIRKIKKKEKLITMGGEEGRESD